MQGLESVPEDDRPPVNVVRIAFQTMVGIGTLLALLGPVYLFVWLRRRRLPESKWFYRAVVVAGPLSVVALLAGWVTTEVGRQPWVVYGVMRTEEAVTGADGIPVGYATLALVYAGLAGRRHLGAATAEPRAARARPRSGLRCRSLSSRLPRRSSGSSPTRCWPGPTSAPGSGSSSAAERARPPGPRARPPLDGPGLGGEPRLADLRPRRLLDGLPEAFGSIASTLAAPLFIAAVGIIMRGTAYALRSGTASRARAARRRDVLGVSSILTPFALGAAVGGIASGRVPVGNAAGRYLRRAG